MPDTSHSEPDREDRDTRMLRLVGASDEGAKLISEWVRDGDDGPLSFSEWLMERLAPDA